MNKIYDFPPPQDYSWSAYLLDHWVIFFFTHNYLIQVLINTLVMF